MQMTLLAKVLTDEEAATDLLESMRWAGGRFCPFCGCVDTYRLHVKKIKRRRYKCSGCQKQFTVSVGTVMEDSHIPFGKWIYAIYQMCIAKKGVSALQLSRELGLGYKSAWFMCHRIRYAMSREPLAGLMKGVVEADEAFIGGKHDKNWKAKKKPIMVLVSRGGEARTFALPDTRSHTLKRLVADNVKVRSDLMTDGSMAYKGLGPYGGYNHESVNHGAKEYVRGIVHVNFAESYFSLLKRAVVGTFHHLSAQHMQNYLNEFDYRWTHRKRGAGTMFIGVIQGAEGKRLTFQASKRKDGGRS
jgi:transposase-like protein